MQSLLKAEIQFNVSLYCLYKISKIGVYDHDEEKSQ